MTKTTSMIVFKQSTILSTYQKDQHFPSDEVWLSNTTNTFFLFSFPVIALPEFKQLLSLWEWLSL